MNSELNMTMTGTLSRARRVVVRSSVLALAAGGVLLAGQAGAAQASGAGFVESFTAQPQGPAATLAGGHPDVKAEVRFAQDPTGGTAGQTVPLEDAKNTVVDLPVGLVGNPTVAGQCSEFQLLLSQCSTSSQVGLVTIYTGPDLQFPTQVGLFNVTPAEGVTAQFGFNLVNAVSTKITAEVRPDAKYGLRLNLKDLPSQITTIYGLDLEMWGVPADSSHDPFRAKPGDLIPSGGPSGSPRLPLLTNPVECTGVPPVTKATFESWQHPATQVRVQDEAPALTGCDSLRFDPTMSIRPTTSQAGAPTGLDVDMSFPQDENPDGVGTSRLQRADVRLPEGMVISPSAADGLEGCTDEQAGVGNAKPAACPRASQVGSVDIKSPLLEKRLSGQLFIGSPKPGDMYRLFLVAEGSGVLVKLEGSVKADAVTGQLTATFDNNPQLPVSDLSLSFFSGPRAVLANPRTCGPATATATLKGYGVDTPAKESSSFEITGCGAPRFAPTFTAGTVNPLAGAFSPFTMTVQRTDADQDLSGIALDLPSGLLASLSSVPQCAEAQAAAGSCGAASRVGSTTVAAGPGSSPFNLPGDVFLAGPYKGAPFSLSIVVRAVAGPYDLGTVVVRAPIGVDAANAKVAVPADPLPTILEGIPLQLRRVTINLDRPGFMFNATSCKPMAIGATFTSVSGATSTASSRYQAQGCAGLELDPKLNLAFGGKPEMKKGGHPSVEANLTQKFGQAGLSKVKVVLPLSVALAADNAQGLCKPEEAAARNCPEASIVGSASAKTPALNEPLSGPVYFVEGTRKSPTGKIVKTLPKLWLKLQGEGVPLDLWADSEVSGPQGGQHLVTTFSSVPDAPISSFNLKINGGRYGILAATKNVCPADRKTAVTFDGQNGARLTRNINVELKDCGLQIAKTTVSGSRVKVQLAGVGAGKVSVTGKGLTAGRRTLSSAQTATVTAKLTKASQKAVARGRTVKVKLTATYVPKGSKKSTKVTGIVKVKKARR